MMEGEETCGHTLCLSQEPECPQGSGSGKCWLDNGCPGPRRRDRGGADPAFAAKENPRSVFF